MRLTWGTMQSSGTARNTEEATPLQKKQWRHGWTYGWGVKSGEGREGGMMLSEWGKLATMKRGREKRLTLHWMLCHRVWFCWPGFFDQQRPCINTLTKIHTHAHSAYEHSYTRIIDTFTQVFTLLSSSTRFLSLSTFLHSVSEYRRLIRNITFPRCRNILHWRKETKKKNTDKEKQAGASADADVDQNISHSSNRFGSHF